MNRTTSGFHPSPTNRSFALVVTHPGHELRVHGWLEHHRPRVFVLTDGSGSNRDSRLARTAEIVGRAGASTGSIFGRTTDRGLYSAMLRGDGEWFTRLAEELADALVGMGCDVVVGDAAEGYNSGHDVCRLVIDSAVEIARTRGQAMENLEFLLEGAPYACPESRRASLQHFTLDDAVLDRKLAAARQYEELRAEVQRALDAHGTEPFAHEYLWSSTGEPEGAANEAWVPYYEVYGRQQVAAGLYERLVTYAEHVRPIRDVLRSAARSQPCPA